MLKKGDLCYVRHNGKIKEAIYIEPSNVPKYHRVTVCGREHNYILAIDDKPFTTDCCRFVCMTGLNSEQQQSLGLKVKER